MSSTISPPIGFSKGRIRVRFLGRNAPSDRASALETVTSRPLELAALHQVHSDCVVEATAGTCGKADGLWTRIPNLVLSLVTADCVPVVIADQTRIAAAHAGWRGIAGGLIDRVAASLGDSESLAAWIGPAIGPCCYEVDRHVADLVRQASDATVVLAGPSEKPHLDLPAAVSIQLRAVGIADIHTVHSCTRCQQADFWSYRAAGSKAGRNFTFAWLDGHAESFVSDRSPDS